MTAIPWHTRLIDRESERLSVGMKPDEGVYVEMESLGQTVAPHLNRVYFTANQAGDIAHALEEGIRKLRDAQAQAQEDK